VTSFWVSNEDEPSEGSDFRRPHLGATTSPVVLPLAALLISVTRVPTMVEQNVNTRRVLTSLTAFEKASFVIVVVALHAASIWEWDQ
jgi:hypothetical protein